MEINAKVSYGDLKKAIQAMSKEYKVKVGLLANKGGSEEISENLDYAGLGAVHEFGADIKITPKMAAYLGIKAKELGLPPSSGKGSSDSYIHIPARSWLQMPLEKKSAIKRRLIKHFGESKESIDYYISKTGDLYSLAIMLGASAVEQIHEAFESGGFGEWAANSPMTIAQKGSAKPLIDTGELRRKITFEVEKRG